MPVEPPPPPRPLDYASPTKEVDIMHERESFVWYRSKMPTTYKSQIKLTKKVSM